MTQTIQTFKADGMTCTSCEKIIHKQMLKVPGVVEGKSDYETQIGEVTFDDEQTSIEKIFAAIEEKGYSCETTDEVPLAPKPGAYTVKKRTLGVAFAAIGLIIIGFYAFRYFDTIALPEISPGMGYGLLFVVGLLTGFHCIGMCGGFVVAYTTKAAQQNKKPHKLHMRYAMGKTISYTIIGAIFGFIGSLIAFTPFLRGMAGVIAGVFLIVFGLNMLNVYPALRKLRLRTPRFLTRFVGTESKKHSDPLVIGLLNGLMLACGPLQAIYIMAAGTGSALEGAKVLFMFGLGTLPVMLGFGYAASFLSNKATQKLLKASGVIVLILGVIMINRGLALTGTGYDLNSVVTSVSATSGFTGNVVGESGSKTDGIVLKNGYQEIRMSVTNRGWVPNKFVLQKDVPVKWIVSGDEINGCNRAIQVPKYDLKFDVKPGEQIIEFTPTSEGVVPFSCWMGMIPGSFIVKDDIDLSNTAEINEALDEIPEQKGGSCGMGASGGGCGCGG